MKAKIENLKDSQRLIKIEVEAETVDSVIEQVYNDIQKRVRIPGYRIGRAPRDLLEAHYGKAVDEEALERLVSESYAEAVERYNLDPVSYPGIEDVGFERGRPLHYTAKVDVRPDFDLNSYKGIKIKEVPSEVNDEETETALKNLQESMAQYKNIEARPVKMGDYIICNFNCLVEGKSVDKNDKLWLYINDQLQPKELLSALLGAELNITKEIEVAHPKGYPHKELAGRKALYRITPQQIKEKSLPEINEDFAKEAGHFKSLAELKEQLRKNIKMTKEQENRRSLEEQIFANLLKNHSFEIPRSVVERQAKRLIEGAKFRLIYQGYKKEDIDKQDEGLKKMVHEDAKNSVRLFFILEKIAKEENIGVTDEEMEEKIKAIALRTKEDPEELKKRLKEKHLIDNLKDQLVEDKVVEFLLKEANRN